MIKNSPGFITAALFAICFIGEYAFFPGVVRGQEKDSTIVEVANILAQGLSKNRRIAIHPDRPRTGIKTGLVIAYGHLMQPPFVVESRNSKFFVNGVQVMPSIIDERESAAQKQPIMDAHTKEISDSLWKTDVKIQDMARAGIPHEKILEFAEKQPYVHKVELAGANALLVTDEVHVDSPLHIMLPQIGQKRLSNEDIGRRSVAATRNRVLEIQSMLNNGRYCVVFVDSGVGEKLITRKFPSGVPKIMEDSTLSENDKFIHLHKLFGSEGVAADIVENYAPDEWSIKRP